MAGRGNNDERGLLVAGDAVGDYQIGNLIASGGFGAVYAAERMADRQPVALKLIHQFRFNSETVARFQREAEAMRKLDHPSVVKLFDVGLHTDGRPFMVMEFLNGIGLDRYLASQVRMSLAGALEILDPICEALSVAHAAGLVHRDIKASNIFLENWGMPEQRVVLLDFGLVKLLGEDATDLTTSRHRIGTPFAMAPEQITSGDVDGRTDVYGVGNLAYLLLTGRLPFSSPFSAEVQEMHLHATVPDPCVVAPLPPAVGAALVRALEKEPRHRFSTILQFRDALRTRASAAKGEPEIAIAAYVEVMTSETDLEDADNDLLDDMENLVALVGRFFVHASFETMIASGTRALYVQALQSKTVGLPFELQALMEEIENRPAPHPRLHWKLCLHTASEGKCKDGGWRDELTATESWVPIEGEGLSITNAARSALGLPETTR